MEPSAVAVLVADVSGGDTPSALLPRPIGTHWSVNQAFRTFPARHRDSAPLLAYGDFRDCNARGIARVNPATGSPTDDPTRLASQLFDGAWMSCAHGCCTSDYPPRLAAATDSAAAKQDE